MLGKCDLILVVGSQTSSNSNRLKEIAEKQGISAFLIDNANEIKDSWLVDKESVGVTAGASAPEILVEQVVKKLKDRRWLRSHRSSWNKRGGRVQSS